MTRTAKLQIVITDITFLNVNGRRYVGKVVLEQIYVGSLFRNSNVNTALAGLKIW